jgi:mxaC protein
MDDHMLPADWRKLDRSLLLHHLARGQPKAKVARDLLAKFVLERPDDRFGLMFFSTKPLSVVSFTQHDEVVQAGIAAADIGRGLANTEVGRALLAAIAEFDRRTYSGSRIILLVSDGGAYLDEPTRQRVLAGLARNRIALYWIYLRSYNAPTLDNSEPARENAPEIALHTFFQTLRTPYRAYQAEVPEDLEKAVADVGRQQNFPLDFLEEVPRQDYSRRFVAAAAICCLLLLLGRSLALRSWA